MHRFYLNEKLDTNILVVKDKAILHQLKNVLRLRKGDLISFFNNEGAESGFDFSAELKNIERASANFLIKEKKENTREPNKKIILYQSLVKKERFEQILQHGAEIGISEFFPVVSRRAGKKSLQQDRCEKILREASEQSGRAIVPKLGQVLDFKKAVQKAQDSGFKTYFACTEEKDRRIYGAGDRYVNLFIGPEGGWDASEIFAMQRAGFIPISLGKLTFRAETAAIVASYTLLWG
ncbi:MAG: RsmE family RNA methyltransferase [Patescibacteria group bacterium]